MLENSKAPLLATQRKPNGWKYNFVVWIFALMVLCGGVGFYNLNSTTGLEEDAVGVCQGAVNAPNDYYWPKKGGRRVGASYVQNNRDKARGSPKAFLPAGLGQNYDADLKKLKKGQPGIAMQRHHMAPSANIIKWYKSMLENDKACTNRFMDVVITALTHIPAHMWNPECSNCADKLREVAQKIARGNQVLPDGESMMQLLYLVVYWPTNIFVGPRDRSDDAGAQFERKAQCVLNNVQFGLWQQITNLADRLREFVEESPGYNSDCQNLNADGARIDQVSLDQHNRCIAVVNAFGALDPGRNLMQFSQPLEIAKPTDRGNWEKDGRGNYRIHCKRDLHPNRAEEEVKTPL